MAKDNLWILATGAAYILGVATGILLVKEHIRDKYRKLADEEVESVKEAFTRNLKRVKAEQEQTVAQAEKRAEDAANLNLKNIQHYERLLREKGYVADDEPESAVYIHPDEFGEIDGYSASTITFYEKSGVFTDEMNQPIDDEEWEDMLGCGVAKHFDEYESDRVCIRNDKRRSYYEVLLDEGEYEP